MAVKKEAPKGTTGKDKLIGTAAADKFAGLAGADTLNGMAGNDTLDGGAGDDVLDGGTGNDSLIGGDGNDILTGGSGDDFLSGDKGNDKLDGGAGNDTLSGGIGSDSMTGGDGNDYYVVDNKLDTVIETNKNDKLGGKDTIETTLNYTLGNNIENLILTGITSNTGMGNKLNNVITGNIGDNLLKGDAGNDSIIGGNGDDTLDGGLGMDTLVGGAGADTYFMNNTEDKIVEDENSTDQDQIIATVTYDLSANPTIEILTLQGNKAVSGIGNDLDNTLQESDGGTVANNFNGGAGNDVINAEGGNDTVEGGEGNDELNGGAGEDVAIYNDTEDNYQITPNIDAEGVAQLVIKYVGNDETKIDEGEDILSDIEIVQFSDGTQKTVSTFIDSEAAALTEQDAIDNSIGTATQKFVLTSKTDMATVTPKMFAEFTATDFALLTKIQFSSLTPEQFASLKPTQIAFFSVAQIKAIPIDFMELFTPAVISALSVNQIAALSANQIEALSQEGHTALPGYNTVVVPIFSIKAPTSQITEGNTLTFTITTSSAVTVDTTFMYQIKGVNSGVAIEASPAEDLGKVTGTVIIPARQTSGTFTLTPINDFMTEGFEAFNVSLLDSSFNAISVSNNVVILDSATTVADMTTAPAAPVINSVAGDDCIDAVEKAAGVILTGMAESDATVSVTISGRTGTASVSSDGTWSYTLPMAVMVEGELIIEVTAIDKAGNMSEAVTKNVIVDTIPSFTAPSNSGQSAVSVFSGGVSDASVGNAQFDFTAGNYTYTIANFGVGDVLNFPDGMATVINDDLTDQQVDVQWAANGQIVTVTLTGLTNDVALYSISSFNGLFGVGSII
ncbi:MAG: Ig-like domain-containing protein [Methylococcaceae bacterium]